MTKKLYDEYKKLYDSRPDEERGLTTCNVAELVPQVANLFQNWSDDQITPKLVLRNKKFDYLTIFEAEGSIQDAATNIVNYLVSDEFEEIMIVHASRTSIEIWTTKDMYILYSAGPHTIIV